MVLVKNLSLLILISSTINNSIEDIIEIKIPVIILKIIGAKSVISIPNTFKIDRFKINTKVKLNINNIIRIKDILKYIN